MIPSITDPVHLRQELLWINKQLPAKLFLSEDSHGNVWHYYRFLTMNPVIHGSKLVLMIRILLIDLYSVMTLYKIYNLLIYNHNNCKYLQYVLEQTNLAITKDNKYTAILSDTKFIQCTLADRHFCVLNTGLYHIDMSQCCVTAVFKDDDKIDISCRLALSNITGPQASHLDQGLWAIPVEELASMEVKCKYHSHVKTLEPPFTLMNLQPACNNFSSIIKLPPYFKQYSSGFLITLKSVNLHILKFTPFNFRVWEHFDLSYRTKLTVRSLRTLALAPNIPINQLRAQIANFRCITSVAAIGTNSGSVPGWVTVRIQNPAGAQCTVLSNDMQFAFASALLDQLEDYGANVRKNHRRLRDRHHTAKSLIEAKPSLEIQDV